MMNPIRMCIVGGGWRADFFQRIAKALPEEFEMVGATARKESTREKIAAMWGVPVFGTTEEMIDRTRPDFAINCGGWDTIVDVMRPLHACKVPVLCETPPGWHREQQEEMFGMVKEGLKMQVAEQGWLQPEHQAGIAFCRSGRLGDLTLINAAGGGYHGMALVRKYLGLGFEIPTIRAIEKRHPILEGPGRDGPPTEEKLIETRVTHVTLEFDSGQLAILTSSGQHFQPIRKGHLHVHGTRGCIHDKRITWLKDYRTPLEWEIVRKEAGPLERKVLQAVQIGDAYYWENRWNEPFGDDEIAVAETMRRMAVYCQTGEEFYSFADAAWDQTICLLMKQATIDGGTHRPEQVPWII